MSDSIPGPWWGGCDVRAAHSAHGDVHVWIWRGMRQIAWAIGPTLDEAIDRAWRQVDEWGAR